MNMPSVDLPDPLNPPDTTSLNADDLLSKLAGDEIDRLLADAGEIERPQALGDGEQDEGADAAENPIPSAESTVDVQQQRAIKRPRTPHEAGLFSNRPERSGTDADEPNSASSDVEFVADMTVDARDLDQSLVEHAPADLPSVNSDGDSRPPDPGPEQTRQRPAVPPLPMPRPWDGPAAEQAAAPAPACVPDSLSETAATNRARTQDDPATKWIARATEPPPLPFYLRPLEWINAPFAACSTRAREVIGKTAIVTFINAAAVLVYVLIFRE